MDTPDPTYLNLDDYFSLVDYDPLSSAENTVQMVFDQSQKEFSIPNQGGAAGTLGMNQTSRGVINSTMNFDPNHLQSVPPRPSNYGTKIPRNAQNKEKKKETDKACRERRKVKDEKTKDEIKELHNENAHLKEENASLIKVTSTTNESSQSATAEKEKLENEISLLTGGIKSLQNQLDLYSRLLVDSNHVDHQAELIHLKNKISILRQNSNRNNWTTKEQELKDEIAKLERENKVLKLQVEAVSEMNIDKDIEEKQA